MHQESGEGYTLGETGVTSNLLKTADQLGHLRVGGEGVVVSRKGGELGHLVLEVWGEAPDFMVSSTKFRSLATSNRGLCIKDAPGLKQTAESGVLENRIRVGQGEAGDG
jgi:hypothetical protein